MTDTTNESAGRLKTIIERVERLNEDMSAVKEDRKAVFAEAKGDGFDTKAIRAVIKIRAADRAKMQEEQAMTDLYLTTIGEPLL